MTWRRTIAISCALASLALVACGGQATHRVQTPGAGTGLLAPSTGSSGLATTAVSTGDVEPDQSKPLTIPSASLSDDTSTHDRYLELRLFAGMGSSAAHRIDAGASADDSDRKALVMSGASVVLRRDRMLYGVIGEKASGVFGEDHSHGGMLVGLAAAQKGAHLEVMAEVGIHDTRGIGEDLFVSSSGSKNARAPYVGAQGRIVMDPGKPNGIVLDVATRVRRDVTSKTVDITTTSWMAQPRDETWKTGGTAFALTAGIGYQFD